MSSPEAHSSTPQNPDQEDYLQTDPELVEYFVANRDQQAYSAEATPAPMTELTPEQSARMENEIRAEKVLENVQQLWNEADAEVREAVWHAMTDVKADQAAIAQAKYEDKNHWEPLVKRLKEELAPLTEAEKKQKEQDGKKGKIDSLRLQTKRRKSLFKEGEIQKAEQDKYLSRKEILGAPEKSRKEDEVKRTQSYKTLMGDLSKIEASIEKRSNLRAQLETMPADDPDRARIEAEVAEPDEAYRARSQEEAGKKYQENLRQEELDNKHAGWAKAFAESTEDAPSIQSQIENYLENEKKIKEYQENEAKGTPNTLSTIELDTINAQQLLRGDFDGFKRKLMEGVSTDETDEVLQYHKEWLVDQDSRNLEKATAEVDAKVKNERTSVIDEYLKLQVTANQIANGTIDDENTKSTNGKKLHEMALTMEQWPEWKGFSQLTEPAPTDPDELKAHLNKHLAEPHKNKLMQQTKDKQMRRLIATKGY